MTRYWPRTRRWVPATLSERLRHTPCRWVVSLRLGDVALTRRGVLVDAGRELRLRDAVRP